jgi:hypothetical protein
VGRRRAFRLAAARLCLLLFIVALAHGGCVVRQAMEDVDKEECAALTTPLRARFTFPESAAPAGPAERSALFCGIEGRGVLFPTLYTRLTIYGVADQPTQDGILDALTKVPREGFKPIVVRFYERELWTVTYSRDGNTSSARQEIDKQKLLRQAVLR